MRERGIIFSEPMVRALLAGTKTQTRRIVKPQPETEPRFAGGACIDFKGGSVAVASPTVGIHCPYGQPGDRLWVRETYAFIAHEKLGPVADSVIYRADDNDGWEGTWRPSIFMPRCASRITLELTAVRVERLQDISEADAVAEGTPCYVCGRAMDGLSQDDCHCCHCFHRKAGASDYRRLWESINGEGSWAANPWVWALTFKRV